MIGRIFYLIGSVIISLLTLRFLLVLIGANPANGFVNFIYTASRPFAEPFFGIVNYRPDFGAAQIEWGTLIGIIVFGIATAVLGGLLSGPRRTYYQ